MATPFLCVRASELAEAIGRQKHTEPYQALERIWRRLDNAGYTQAYRRNSKQTEEEKVQAIFEANPQVAEIFATADVTQIDNSHSTITTAGDAINAVCARSELSTEDKLMLSERIQKRIVTNYGTVQEDVVYSELKEKHGLDIKKDNTFYKKNMGEIQGKSWFIGGRVDAVTCDRSQVVEIKNRVGELKNRVRRHDHVQVQCYMQLLGMDLSTLAECYTSSDGTLSINIFKIKKDQSFWESTVVPRITNFMALLVELLDNTKLQDAYLNCDREEFVNQVIRSKGVPYFYCSDDGKLSLLPQMRVIESRFSGGKCSICRKTIDLGAKIGKEASSREQGGWMHVECAVEHNINKENYKIAHAPKRTTHKKRKL